MTVSIHGKNYITVAERLTKAHAELKKLDITTEVLFNEPKVVIKATVVTPKGIFTGISAANANKNIEKESPYEVAESSAVGRALAFAGYETTQGIASAEEIKKAESGVKQIKASMPQVKLIATLLNKKGVSTQEVYDYFKVNSLKELSVKQAGELINRLMGKPDLKPSVDGYEDPD